MITKYIVTDRRTMLTEYVSGTRENRYEDAVNATYDAPTVCTQDVLRAFKRGEATVGYEVVTTVVGEGTTALVWEQTDRWGFDDYESGTHAAYRDAEGVWHDWCCWTTSLRCGEYAITVDAPELKGEWDAHLKAKRDAEYAVMHARRLEDDAREARQERASIDRDKFVLVARGRKVPVGTVGRITWTGEGEYGMRVGIASTLRTETATARSGRTYDKALDVAWSAASNCDVLLPMMPDSRAEIATLYRFANAVSMHCYPVGQGEHITTQTVTETFPAVWTAAYAAQWRLAVMAAYAPTELPRLDAETPRTLAEVCEAVEGMPDVAHFLTGMVAEYDAANSVDVWKASARAMIESCLGVVWVAPAKKTRKPRAPKAPTATV